MSSHSAPSDDYTAHASGTTKINDPGLGGLIDLASKSGGVLTLLGGGDRLLPSPPRGVSFVAFAESPSTLTDRSGNVVAYLDSEECALCVSSGGGAWGGIVIPADEALNNLAPSLSLVAANGTTGYDVADTSANADRLNGWSEGGWRTNRSEIGRKGRRVGLSETWDSGMIAGVSLATTGLTQTNSENQFGGGTEETFNVGGPATGYFWSDKSNLTGPMIRFRGYGWDFGCLNLAGNYHLTDPNTLKADLANRKEIGVEVLGRDVEGKLPVGKSKGDFHLSLFETGIKTVPTPFEDNADQFRIGRLCGQFCDTIFHSTNKQTLGNRFDYIDQFHTTIGINYERGGKHWTGTHCIQTGSHVGVLVSGNDTTTFGYITTDQMILDGSSDADCLAVQVAPISGFASVTINIGHLDIDNNITDRTSSPCIHLVNYYGRLNIHGGSGLYERMIHVTGGVEQYHPTIYVSLGRFRSGTDLNNASIRELFTADSDGWLNLIFVNNSLAFGSGSQLFEPYSETIEINSEDSTVVVH